MSRELQVLLEALRLEQQEKGSLTVADEIEEILDWLAKGQRYRDGDCPLCA